MKGLDVYQDAILEQINGNCKRRELHEYYLIEFEKRKECKLMKKQTWLNHDIMNQFAENP